MTGNSPSEPSSVGKIAPLKLSFPGEDFTKQLNEFFRAVAAIGNGIVQSFGHLAIFAKRCDLIEAAGWLPHPAAPLDIISVDQDAATVGELLQAHYRDNWVDIERQFSERVGSYQIDDEAKAVFQEALELHKLGHYRAVVRLLFPEIERVACKEVYLGDQYERRPNGKKDGLITSLKSLRHAAGNELGLSDFGDVRYSLSLFSRMSEHLYESVGEDQAVIAKYANDAVPNRHAALHGIVIYKTLNNSINTLIMTDFMFGIIDALKRHHARQRSGTELSGPEPD